MVRVSPRTELVGDKVGQFLEVFVFTRGQSATDFRIILEVVVGGHVVSSHHPLGLELIGSFLRPHHYKDVDTFVGFLLQDLTQVFVGVSGLVSTTEQL